MVSLHTNATAKFAVLDLSSVKQKSATSTDTSRKDGARLTKASGPKIAQGAKIGGVFTKEPAPAFTQEREVVWDQAKAARDAEAKAGNFGAKMTITMPDGATRDGVAYETTPLDVALAISKKLAGASCVARVTYSDPKREVDPRLAAVAVSTDEDDDKPAVAKAELWDLQRPLEGGCTLELLPFDSPEGAMVFWHSSAHLLGAALEQLYGARLSVGPPVEGGFYYDAFMGDLTIAEADFKTVNQFVAKVVNTKATFERLVLTKEELLKMFAQNPFKSAIIQNKIPDGGRSTAYRSGPIIDLCMGPHLPDAGRVKAFEILRASTAYWLGQAENDTLMRVYGHAFPDKKELTKRKALMAEAAKRDHRRLGQQQKLFFFDPLSPGSAFFEPHGARIYNGLMDFIKEQYWIREYTEVVTPNVFNFDLWHTSGHALHYKDNMFCFEVEGAEFGLKPMNCPAHCIMFAKSLRSWRDLPMRYADFGVLHRNELSGALTGLTRVRRFQQDDAHIFCREDQVEAEVKGALDFMKYVYSTFGMSYKLELSTRPKKALGDVALWDRAEKALASAMDDFAGKGGWRVNPGDGAFYGPKIDIKVTDALERVHQCATIQLDFQLPLRFDLKYRSKDDDEHAVKRPIIIHRAMLGSVERMIAVLTEHWGGKWPLWISPRQVIVVPVAEVHLDYANDVRKALREAKLFVDVDASGNTLPKKVRNAQLAQYNFILVVGDDEVAKKAVAVRTRANTVEGTVPLGDFVQRCKDLVSSKAPDPPVPEQAAK